MTADAEVLRYTAFAESREGGNPAGVVLDAHALSDAQRLALAAEVGYSETAFLSRRQGRDYEVRYFSPLAEVPFCGHATIAAAAALAEHEGAGLLQFHTRAGIVPVETRISDGRAVATLTSVPPQVEETEPAHLQAMLDALRWSRDELDPALPPRIAYAGARHLVLAARTRERLARLDYDFTRLQSLMRSSELTTVALIWRESDAVVHARNPFPVGGVVEDPATGAAAAALGGYLLALGALARPARFLIRQGEDMGRPSRIEVELPEGSPGVRVSGAALRIERRE